MKNFTFLALVLAGLAVLAGCEWKPEKQKTLTLMTWNVHNLFDGKDDGFEYLEFQQSAGWSQEKYLGRINAICDAIGRFEPLPDIIILQEIESLNILEDISCALPDGYYWSHFANSPGAAVGVGIISRVSLADQRAHTAVIGANATPRPVLEVRVQTEAGDFFLMICHWKSKIGGAQETEQNRRSSARLILRRAQEIWEDEPDAGIIIAGDLNLNHDEFSRRGSNAICALIPDEMQSALRASNIKQKDYIVLSGERPPVPVHFSGDTITFFSPWINELENGSYLYRDSWETIDHFLVSGQFFDNAGWEYGKTVIVNSPPFVNADGNPVSYIAKTGHGFSDHLPLLMTIFIF
ncbi:MAG: endonuclease/exonuclease/phosphatase family protein [Treponema sp.]|nr:endonuclease/exonuclease/phosphatase family protein [Treponema sp.]MCL2236893.1 endonuclease/exonuclease/phosphatase family protein [Treponema sp.]